MKKVVLVAFNGEVMCFAHVLLNAKDMHLNGVDVKVVIEGAATGLINVLEDSSQPFANLYSEIKSLGLVDAVCKACAVKMGALEAATAQNLPLRDEMAGHPGLLGYLNNGYEILTF